MYFSKLIVTITAALVASAAAAPQRNGNNRGNRITVTDSVITQSNVCGNKSQNPYCCASDRGSGGNVCTVSSSKFCHNLYSRYMDSKSISYG